MRKSGQQVFHKYIRCWLPRHWRHGNSFDIPEPSDTIQYNCQSQSVKQLQFKLISRYLSGPHPTQPICWWCAIINSPLSPLYAIDVLKTDMNRCDQWTGGINGGMEMMVSVYLSTGCFLLSFLLYFTIKTDKSLTESAYFSSW